MRRDDQRRRTVETDQTERAQAVVGDHGGIGYMLMRRWKRMEMRGAGGLRKEQYGRADAG
jgi:hypothetical protein